MRVCLLIIYFFDISRWTLLVIYETGWCICRYSSIKLFIKTQALAVCAHVAGSNDDWWRDGHKRTRSNNFVSFAFADVHKPSITVFLWSFSKSYSTLQPVHKTAKFFYMKEFLINLYINMVKWCKYPNAKNLLHINYGFTAEVISTKARFDSVKKLILS